MFNYLIATAILFSFLYPVSSCAQERDSTKLIVYKSVESMPEPTYSIGQYVSANIQYPKPDIENNIEGRALVSFVVAEDGTIINVETVRQVSPTIDAEARRLVENMPKWKPGKQGGHCVKVAYTLPINFKLNYVTETMPEPGYDILAFIKKHLKYPKEDRLAKREGKVLVEFIVTESGDLSDIKIAKSLSATADAEATRIVSIMPKWKPGTQNSKPVKIYYKLPIQFSL